jgi:hypothetical protein
MLGWNLDNPIPEYIISLWLPSLSKKQTDILSFAAFSSPNRRGFDWVTSHIELTNIFQQIHDYC